MAEIGEHEPIPSSSGLCENEIIKDEEDEPSSKRRKTSKSEKTPSDKLEHRLGGILCCAVCLDLPRAAVYQCTNGHLMCAGCFTHVLADARLRDETATCPNCRVEISKTSASRNLAVEKAISELPSECQYCAKEFPRHALDNHQDVQCDERPSGCKYWPIGCPWQGPHHELAQHEGGCPAPSKSGAEVMEVLEQRERQRQEELALYDQMFELLSFEKITFSDLQLKPYRTEEFVNKLYYETSRFSAFNHQWVVKAYINNSQRDPTQSSEREITYQLILKSKSSVGLSVQYVALRGPHGDARVKPRVHAHCFGDDAPASPDAPPAALPLPDARETNRLLSNKAISFRLIMFLASK